MSNLKIEINKFGIFFVTGRNGVGKSTLFNSMLGEVYRISINNKLIVKGNNKIVYINEMKILLAMNFFYLKNI